MGGGASANLPDHLDLERFKLVAGDRFNQEIYDEHKGANGYISKEKVLELHNLTDCFLTHDWGNDELGRSNHERVARVNESLKERGFVTWFDSDRLEGNIVAQMCSGIDNTKCILVFITKNYIEKVSGSNANDNCQLEFNYALRQKSSKNMIAVVMENRVRDTQTWKGAVGMALGGSLYVDMVHDSNWEAQCDELAKRIYNLIQPIRKAAMEARFAPAALPAVLSRSVSPASVPKKTVTKPLSSLSSLEVIFLLRNLNLSAYMEAFQKKGVDGATLSFVRSEEEIVALGVDILPKARMFYDKLCEFQRNGVAVELLSSPTSAANDAASSNYFTFSPRSVSPAPASAATAPTPATAAPATAAPAAAAGLVSAIGDALDASLADKKTSRYAWFKYQSTSHTNLNHTIRKVSVCGVSGVLEKKLNGDYCMYQPDDSDGGVHPVFRKLSDPDVWLEYLVEKKCWQIKSTASRGSRSCLAEQACPPTKSIFLCDKAWMVHDGKGSFTEQPAVKVLPFLEHVHIFGVSSRVGGKINGEYVPSHEIAAGHPVFTKRGDPDMCIEFNLSRSRWQVKTVAAKGANGCLAENGETVTCTSYTPSDVSSVWVVCEDHKFAPDPHMHVVSSLRRVRLRGGFGKACTLLAGVYQPCYKLVDGQMRYRHEDHGALHLEYSLARRMWQIRSYTTPTASPHCLAELTASGEKDAEAGSGASTPIVSFDGNWSIYEEPVFHSYPDVYLSPVFDTLFVSFSTTTSLGEIFDEFIHHCSGLYVPLERAFQHFPVYKHRSPSHMHYLRYDNDLRCWQLHSSTQLSPLSPKRYVRASSGLTGDHVAVFQQAGQGDHALEDCSGQWTILQEEAMESNGQTQGRIDVRILARPSAVHVLDATGPRAALINGAYDLADEVCDHMVVYKKRAEVSPPSLSSNHAAGGGEVVRRDPREVSDVWIEYSAALRCWQLKRTADRGSAKAYASLPAQSAQFVHVTSTESSWTVFDVTHNQWMTQAQVRCLPAILPVVISGATGGHKSHINGRYEPTMQSFQDMPLYRKVASPSEHMEVAVWLEFNKALRCWQVKSDKDRGQNKAWAYLTTSVTLRPEECEGTWEVFDAELKWHAQPQVSLQAVRC